MKKSFLNKKKTTKKRKAIIVELTDWEASSPSPEEEINYSAEIISNYLFSLDKSSRILFMRRYYLGESVADAAKAVGITENYAGVKLSRIRNNLRIILEEEGITV